MKKILLTIVLVAAMTCQAQTIQEVKEEIIRQGLPHPEIVLAQARLETGNFKSVRCRRDHNLFGIKHGRRYARYSHWKESVADYKKRISSRYHGGDYYLFLERIHYAADKRYTEKLKKFR